MRSTTPFTFRTIVLTVVGIMAGLLAIGLLIFQARYLLIGPQIVLFNEITEPQNERVVTLTGSARNISRLWLNDRQIFTDPTGNFSEAVVLENGQSIVTLRATDRFGRVKTIEQRIVYAPASFYQ